VSNWLRSPRSWLSPPPPAPPLPAHEIARRYPWFRWAVLESTFLGYATFYVVRNNLSTVAKDVGGALHYDHDMIGSILAVSAITYGIGKFVMGAVSDRSNARTFMALGLLLTALCNFAFGSVASYPLHLALWALNGFVQGMGWPPCGRAMGHWFSVRERGSVFAAWNIAHNVGGGIAGVMAAWAAGNWGWQYAFHVPAVIALVGAGYILLRLHDTPQSVGLPPIETYRNDFTEHERHHGTGETDLSFRELLVVHVLRNRALWFVATANFFVYVVRYSMLDWGPSYLREVKGGSLESGGLAIMVIEFAGIPSTLLMGWLSDRLGGRRGMVSLLCMIPILFAFWGILLNPPGRLWLDFTLLGVVGFFVYPPVMLLGVSALDLTSKKAVGTAAGFVGLFGYLGRTAQAKGFGWMVHHYRDTLGLVAGWNLVLYAILACTVAAILLLALTWNQRPRG
jgi:OPA family glycerol-3-phosphate transporter-like MFS transporter